MRFVIFVISLICGANPQISAAQASTQPTKPAETLIFKLPKGWEETEGLSTDILGVILGTQDGRGMLMIEKQPGKPDVRLARARAVVDRDLREVEITRLAGWSGSGKWWIGREKGGHMIEYFLFYPSPGSNIADYILIGILLSPDRTLRSDVNDVIKSVQVIPTVKK